MQERHWDGEAAMCRDRQRVAGQRGAYPELFAVVGGQVPDLRGLFLRGFGGKSAALGTTQDQATASSGIQIATAFIDLGGGGWDGWAYAPYPQAGSPGRRIMDNLARHRR